MLSDIVQDAGLSLCSPCEVPTKFRDQQDILPLPPDRYSPERGAGNRAPKSITTLTTNVKGAQTEVLGPNDNCNSDCSATTWRNRHLHRLRHRSESTGDCTKTYARQTAVG